MSTWADFTGAEPELARFAHERLNGEVSYLATVRKDGSPRVHPVTPIIGEGRLFLFLEPASPKGHDLRRDGRYSLHCSVTDSTGASGEVLIRGTASFVQDAEARAIAFGAAKFSPAERYILFEFSVEEALTTEYVDATPIRRKWKAN